MQISRGAATFANGVLILLPFLNLYMPSSHIPTSESVSWPLELALTSFEALKLALSTPLGLSLFNFDKHFHLYHHKNNRIARKILRQPFTSQIQSIAYFSCQLDTVASAMSPCLCAIAIAATLIEKAISLILGSHSPLCFSCCFCSFTGS